MGVRGTSCIGFEHCFFLNVYIGESLLLLKKGLWVYVRQCTLPLVSVATAMFGTLNRLPLINQRKVNNDARATMARTKGCDLATVS